MNKFDEINNEDVDFLEEHALVFLDVEATGLKRPISIVQVGAVCEGGKTFDHYIVPFKPIERQASRLTKLKLVHGTLYYKEKPVMTLHAQGLFEMLADWIESVCTKPATIVAYNGFTYDFPVLAKHARYCGVDMGSRMRKDGKHLIKGFLDPLVYMKKAFPENRKYNQEHMMSQFGLQCEGEAHSAIMDAKNLKTMFNALMNQERAVSLKNVPECFKNREEFFENLARLEV